MSFSENNPNSSESNQGNMVLIGEKFFCEEKFAELFTQGMTLVETAADYLDNQGREDCRHLQRLTALNYTTESMRLTTRLMQLASWLLLQRAVKEGEMSPEEARAEKIKLKIDAQLPHDENNHFDELPQKMRELVHASYRLQERVAHFDLLLGQKNERLQMENNPVATQMGLLSVAFGEGGV